MEPMPANKTLRDHRGNKIVLLCAQSAGHRRTLAQLAVIAQLQTTEVEIIVVPNLIDRLFVDKLAGSDRQRRQPGNRRDL